MRKIAIGVVTYNPGEILMSRLSLALAEGFVLYIYDNSPENSAVRDFCSGRQNCSYFTCGKNAGLGFAISTVCAQAYYDSFSALLFFDQDTVFDRNTLNFVEEFHIKRGVLAADYSAVMFNSKNAGSGAAKDRFLVKDVLLSINSGSLYFLENLKKLNWHNETYFVDCVDYEFCLNSSNNNLKIGECSNAPGFDHESEQPDVKYAVLGRERPFRRYSARRIFSTVSSTLRLSIASIKAMNVTFFIAIARSLTIYLAAQFAVRFVNVSKLKNTETR